MDIRNWFTSKDSSQTVTKAEKKIKKSPEKPNVKPKELHKVKKSVKRRIIDSDSDEEVVSKKEKFAVKCTYSLSPSQDAVGKKKHKPNSHKKRAVKSSDDECVIDTDSDAETSTKKSPSKPLHPITPKHMSKQAPDVPKAPKFTSVSDFFGSAPVQRTKNAPKKAPLGDTLEVNHGDEDFCKMLLQLEESEQKQHNKKTTKVKTKEGKPLKSKTSKKTSLDIEITPPPPPSVEKKTVVQPIPPEKKKKPAKGGSLSYLSYLHREGPKALGSKPIPEGEEECLKGKTFIISGILESIERDEAKALIEKYSGKVMTTLTKNTNYIVIGRDAGSSKLEKAEKFGTMQLDEDALFDLIQNSPGAGPKKTHPPTAKEMHVKCESENTSGQFMSKNSVKDFNNGSHKNIAKTDDFEKIKVKTLESSVEADVGKTSHFEMWVDKYKPTSLKRIIGQQEERSNAKKLLNWLCSWSKNVKTKRPVAVGRWNAQGDGSGFKAALLSGPPGVGKTTTAQLVCKEAGFDYFELNASDTRSKKSLQNIVAELLLNQSLKGYFNNSSRGAAISKNHVIIMDEVDGMAGNEDRGGIQELIGFIKTSKIPIICICNDRNHPKIRTLSNYCFDLRFPKPRVEQIKAAMMSIAYKEGIDITPSVLHDVITASNQDIRQVLHSLSLWCSVKKGLSEEQAKRDIGFGIKHIKMSPFDALREVFTVGQNKKATITDKANLFFHDYSMAPLFVQENYVHVLPSASQGNKLKHLQLLSEAANSICIGDLIDKQIRSQSAWSLLSTQAIFASVIPGELLTGHLKQMVNFPAWLGKNSNRNHMDRILQELQMHMRMRVTGNKTDIALEYLPLLKRALTKPLLDNETEGVPDVLKAMRYYFLLREDFDNIIELSLWPQQKDPRSLISAKVKSAFTRAYNKECGQNPYAVTSVTKKKKSSNKESEELLGEEDGDFVVDDDDVEEDKIEDDVMIKVKKPPAKKPSSKKDTKFETKKGRSKK